MAMSKQYAHSFPNLTPISNLTFPQSNILIDDKGNALLADFNLLTSSEPINFTAITEKEAAEEVRWMAPELIMGNTKKNQSTDVYAFGLTITEVKFLLLTCKILVIQL